MGTGFLIKEHYWKFDGGVIVENLYLFDFFIFSIVIVLTLLFSIYFYLCEKKTNLDYLTKYVDMIAKWLYIASEHSSNMCANTLNIYIYLLIFIFIFIIIHLYIYTLTYI